MEPGLAFLRHSIFALEFVGAEEIVSFFLRGSSFWNQKWDDESWLFNTESWVLVVSTSSTTLLTWWLAWFATFWMVWNHQLPHSWFIFGHYGYLVMFDQRLHDQWADVAILRRFVGPPKWLSHETPWKWLTLGNGLMTFPKKSPEVIPALFDGCQGTHVSPKAQHSASEDLGG